MMGAMGMLNGGGGGGGPITAGLKEGMDAMEGMGGGPIGAELMAGGGPRFRGGILEANGGGGIPAELTEQIEAVDRGEGPIGAGGFGNPGRRAWYIPAAPDGSVVGGAEDDPEDASSFLD